jgi:hypothetical protein
MSAFHPLQTLTTPLLRRSNVPTRQIDIALYFLANSQRLIALPLRSEAGAAEGQVSSRLPAPSSEQRQKMVTKAMPEEPA